MLRAKQLLVSRYSIAILASLIALWVRFLLNPFLGERAPLLLFILPVMVIAWRYGLQAGLLTTALSVLLGTYFFVPPFWNLQIQSVGPAINVAIFLLEGIIISCLSEALHRAKQRAERSMLELGKQKEQYRLLVESANDYAIYGLDPSGYITSWNRGAERINGYQTAEILGRHVSIFYTDADRAQGKPETGLQAAQETGHYEEEGWRKRKDGSLYQANVVIYALQDDQNNLYGFSKIVRDVTQQKQNEQVLQESYSLLERIIEGTKDAVFIKDLQGRYQLLNSTTAQIFNRPREEVLGKDDQALLPLESAIALQQIDRTVMETGISQTLEEPVQGATEQRIFLTTKDPLRDAEGNIVGVIGIARDITERKQAEEQLQRLVQRLESIHQLDQEILGAVSSAAIAEAALSRLSQTIPCDQAAIVLENLKTNQGTILAGELFGYTTGNEFPLSQQTYVADLHTLDDGSVLFDRATTAQYRSFMAVAMQAEDIFIGNLVLVARQPAAFNPEHQEIAQEIASQLAIAVQQARLREQLQQYAEQLEKRVAERTIALQEANDSLEAFSYSVAHDLQAPLRAVYGLGVALLEDYGSQLDETAQLYIQEIAQSAQQAGNLITNLLEYARLGRTNVTVQALNLTQLVAEVLAQLENDRQASKAEITVENPLPNVMGHHPTLQQVILNLMTNALKFVPADRHPRIHVWAEHRSESVRLWIRDNGIGIAPEHQERIFQPFERLHGAETYSGTGVGLAIVRKGTEKMGGKVGVESELGQGSCFWIELREVEQE